MKVGIEFSSNDRELESYFDKIEEPARPWVAKQLIKLGIQSGMNPYIAVGITQEKKVSKEPDFEYEKPPEKKPITKNEQMPPPKTRIRELSLEEKKRKLERNMSNF